MPSSHFVAQHSFPFARGASRCDRATFAALRVWGGLWLLCVVLGASNVSWAQPAPAAAAKPAPAAAATPAPVKPIATAAPAATVGAQTTPNAAAATAQAGAQPSPQPAAADPEPSVRIPATDAEKATGLPVRAIEVAGNRRTSTEDVLSYLRIKRGAAFKPAELAGDVRALWDSGFFDDIEVDLARTDDGVTLRFLLRERRNIKGLEFSGNDELDNDKLLEIVEVKPNTTLSVPALRRAAQKTRDAYAEKGYYLADVDFSLRDERDNEVTVVFKVTEHNQVSVRRINFIGNESVSSQELRDVMGTGAIGLLSFGSGGAYRQDLLERDIMLINALYYDRGYLNVQIPTPRVMLTADREGIEISLTIREGPRFKIRKLQILEKDADGVEQEPLGGRRALRQMVKSQSGDFFNRAELVKDLSAARSLYRDAGYANVEAEPETEVDALKHEVDIIVPIRRGPLVRVERIEIKGNTKTRDKVIRREMEIEEQQLFSETKMEDSKRRITALGFFERVDVSTEQGSSPDKVVLNYEVTERPTGTFQVGVGLSSVENIIGTAQVQQANLFGNGQQLSVQAQLSSLRQLVNIRFFEPYFLDSDWSFSADFFNQLYVYTDFSRRTTGASVTFGYALVQPTLRLSVTATTQYDTTDTSSTTSFLGSASPNAFSLLSRLPLANLFTSGYTISLRPTITYDTRDNRLFPTSGFYLQASSEFASGLVGSQIEFLRHRVNARVYYPLGGQTGQPGSGFVLKANSELGIITSPNAEGVPIFARYFPGGILDIRGYRLRTVGPRLPLSQALDVNAAPVNNGSTFGGNVQWFSNFEFEFPLLDKVGIRGVAFFDAGNAWNLESQYCKTTPAPQLPSVVQPCWRGVDSLLKMRTSIGGGIRWFSPLGPLRFEWGFPLNPQSYEETSVFEFTIGNFF